MTLKSTDHHQAQMDRLAAIVQVVREIEAAGPSARELEIQAKYPRMPRHRILTQVAAELVDDMPPVAIARVLMVSILDLIARFSMNPNNARGAGFTPPCASFWTGFTMSDHLDFYERVLRWHPSFIPKDKWSNGYRYVFIDQPMLAIFTYCEGDLDLTVDADQAAFDARLASAEEFYGSR